MDGLSDEECMRIVHERIATLMSRYERHPLLRGRLGIRRNAESGPSAG
jgi:hypothetical protein